MHVDLEPLNDKGEVPVVAKGQPQKQQKTQFGPLRVGTDLREHVRVLFVDHRRNLTQHLPSARGSILGRLLQSARKNFTAHENFKKSYEQAMEVLRNRTCDVWPVDSIHDGEDRKKREQENRDEQQKNQRIKEAIGQRALIFVLMPSLEAALGIIQDARDKPRRIAEAIETLDPERLRPLFNAVLAVMQDSTTEPETLAVT